MTNVPRHTTIFRLRTLAPTTHTARPLVRQLPPSLLIQPHQVRMCKACDVTFRGQVTSTPSSFSEYTSECLAEIGKVGDWLVRKGYCEETYAFPLCDNEAFDPVGGAIEGPKLGVARAVRLEGMGSRQTAGTDFRHRVNGGASDGDGGEECRCTQAPEECSCRVKAWANRGGG